MRMLKNWLRFTVIGASVLTMVACGNQQGAGDIGTNAYRTNAADSRTGMNQNAMHNNRNLQMSKEVARAVERIDGISQANVVVGDRNVYVAVELDDKRRGGPGNGLIGGVSTNGVSARNVKGNRTSSITDLGTAGTGSMYNALDIRGSGVRRHNGQSGRIGMNPTGMMGGGTAGQGAIPYGHNQNGDAVGLYGTDRANTGRNGYDSMYMYNGGAYGRSQRGGNQYGVNDTLRSKVQQVVYSMVPNARQVFVSADKDFMKRLGTFNDRIGDGKNGKGVLNEFNAFVGGVFASPFGNARYDMNDSYNMRNRNGVTRQMDNTFTTRNRGGVGELFDGDGDLVDFSPRQPAGTIGTAR